MKTSPLFSEQIELPKATKDDYETVIRNSVVQFKNNAFFRKMDGSKVTIQDYHRLLMMIFYQTFNGPPTLALAGSLCEQRHLIARQYLIRHAEEEQTHWCWVINDLRATGYSGPDPRGLFPSEPSQSYIAFNFYIATRVPLARLAIAGVLESIGATYGKKYATSLCKLLNLDASQATFFFGHGDTDVGHTKEIINVLSQSSLDQFEWAWMCFAAETAFKIYYRMYEEAAGTK